MQEPELKNESKQSSGLSAGPKRSRWKPLVLLTAVGAVILAAGWAFANRETTATKVQLSDKKSDSATPVQPIEVETSAVAVLVRPVVVRVTGGLTADEDSRVATMVAGTVAETHVERGSKIEKDAPLVTLENTRQQIALREVEATVQELAVRLGLKDNATTFSVEDQPEVRSAKSQVELWTANLKRERELSSRQVIAASELDKTVSEYRKALQSYELARQQASQLYMTFVTAKTRLQRATKDLADTTVRAPYDGVVTERLLSPGEYVKEGDVVASMVKTDPLRLIITVPEQSVNLVVPGQKVSFTVTSAPEILFEAVVRNVSPALDQESRALTVEAIVDAPDERLRPGLFAYARLNRPETRTLVAIPAVALRRSGDVSRCYVVRDKVVREQVVNIGEALPDGLVEIAAGLTKNDVVVTKLTDAVQDGVPVR